MVVIAVGLVAFVAPSPASAAPCDEPIINEIACENSLPGNPESEWQIDGAGSGSIQGFTTDISTDQGGTVDFKIDTTASSYRLDIYRMGYYAGDGARLVDTINPSNVTSQPSCLNEPATGLVDCGNWSVSASWSVPTDAVSGIYFARLVRTDGPAGASHVFFVVRDDDGNSDLLFQTADTTWQAYNAYGGNSLYTGSPAGRAYKVSYNRPFTTRDNAPEDSVFNAEYPMVRFIEANGYDVSYSTGIDSDRYGAELLEHKVFVSVGHDEYWSGQQRANVEAARDAGVHLAFFSGNEVFWKTRYEPSIDGSSDPYRTLVSYKETLDQAITDPASPTWTGTWRDARFSPPTDGGNPENGLTGQWFRVNCCEIDMEVNASDGAMRFWRNTRVAALTGNQTTTVGSDIVGYEWDEDPDNGFRPPGTFRVSETGASNVQVLLDEGSSYGVGSATHSMTMYRAPSGALVFGAGTVQWSWGLDDVHDRGPANTADDAAQQATVNLFADMGVQPASLQAGLVPASASTDTTAATATISSPADGTTIGANSQVVVSGTAADVGGEVAGVEVSTDGGSTWRRANGRGSWNYSFTAPSSGSVNVMARAVDDSANLGAPSAPISLAVGAVSCPCSIWPATSTPDRAEIADTSSVAVGAKFRSDTDGFISALRFYRSPETIGTITGHLWDSSGTELASVTFTGTSSGWQQEALGTPVPIVADTTYVSSYHAPNGRYSVSSNYFGGSGVTNGPLTALATGVDGGNGVYAYGPDGIFPSNTYQNENYWADVVFELDAEDTTAPTVVSTDPAGSASGILPGSDVSATFSETVSEASISMTLTGPGGAVAGTTSYDAGTRTMTFNPNGDLAADTGYTVDVAGATDGAGNTMVPVSWTFTTSSTPLIPTDGPGGPIGVVTSGSDPFSAYFAEILRAEGLNEFETFDVGDLNAAKLATFTTVIVGPVSLSGGQVSDLTAWVNAGGNVIASRPDPQLASLLGLAPAAGSLTEGYLLVNTGTDAGAGIVGETMQFHGTADRYTLAGASAVATLYSSATVSTSNPAVTVRDVGSNGGQAAAFTYDLARSVVLTRQGNPAWAGQERDGVPIVRSDDLYFGGAQSDWVDLDKVAIPQADEQQRLLANLIQVVNRDVHPLPRFWYFPDEHEAVIVATGDDHGNGGTSARFDAYQAASPAGCSLADWECYRFSSYIYPSTPLSDSAAAAYDQAGFEVALHPQNGCNNFTSTNNLRSTYTSELAAFTSAFPSLPPQVSSRFHCLVWSDWDSQAIVSAENGIRFDVNYYYYPGSWIQDRPGFMTGSGMPQRFARTDGTMIDVYQGATQMTDESGQSYPFTPDTLLDRALGAEGYYGYFVANMHTDFGAIPEDAALLNSAVARGVPVVSARQVLEFIDGRNASSFQNLTWSSNTLDFDISVGAGANNLTAQLPIVGPGGTSLTGLTRGGSNVSYGLRTIKGQSYALFPAVAGAYSADYAVVVDSTPPSVSSVDPADGATAVSASAVATATFSESVVEASIVVSLTPAGGSAVAGSVSYDSISRTVTLTPTSVLADDTVYTLAVSGATDLAGNTMSPFSSSFTTAAPGVCPCSIWPGSTVPPVQSANDTGSVELGLKFQADQSGFITGVRFYKGASNTGTHVGNLWTEGGSNLASVTFTGETATGWQEALFASPVAVTAGTTYVVSYHAPNGGYALETNGLNAAVANGPLTALASGASGGNGLYLYSPGGFPTNSWQASNYFVDVVFDSSGGPVDTTPPTVTSVNPADGATDVAASTTASATFSEPVVEASIVASLTPAGGSAVAGSVSYDSISRTVTLTPTSVLADDTVYTLAVSGATDGAGNTMAAFSSSFTTTAAVDSTPPSVSSVDPADGATAVSASAVATATFSESVVEASIVVSLTPAGGSAVAGSVSYDSISRTVTLTPTSVLADDTVYTLAVSGATDGAGNTMSPFSSSFTTAAAVDSTPPSVSSVDPADGATAVSASAVATATFSESVVEASIVVSLTPAGGSAVAGSVSYDSISRTVTLTPTSVLADDTVYTLAVSGATDGAGNTMAAFSSSFTTTAAVDSTPPSVSSVDPADGATAVSASAVATATFSEPVVEASIVASLTPAGGSAVAGSVSYDSISRTVTLTPTSVLADDTVYTLAVSGATDLAGNTMSPFSSSFTTAAAGVCPCSIWSASTVPPVQSANDTGSVELGLKFQTSQSGFATGVRFYKGASNTGTHVGNLWTEGGANLGSVTFTGETATGWQEALFASPVAVTAGTTYVVSYHAPNGGYALESNGLSSAVANGPLTALASGGSGGNGLFIYGSGGFPTNSWQASNYFVDVVFDASGGPVDSTPPSVSSVDPADGATAVSASAVATATFSEPVVEASIVASLTPAGGSAVAGSVSYDSISRTVTLTPTSVLADDTVYTLAVSGATDLAGNTMSPFSSSFTTAAAGVCPCSIWSASTVPPVQSANDTGSVELGLKFQTSQSGFATGVRFYKGASNTGTHVGNLWTEGGANLGSVTFTGETATGWQEALFASPVAVTAGTTYVVSYHAPNGGYALEGNGLAAAVVSGPLTALASGSSGGNGVYVYGAGGFPSNSWQASNYFVDVMFETSAP